MAEVVGADARTFRDAWLADEEARLASQRERARQAIKRVSAQKPGEVSEPPSGQPARNSGPPSRARRPPSKPRGSKRRFHAVAQSNSLAQDTCRGDSQVPFHDEIVVLPKLADMPDYHLYTPLSRCFAATEAAVHPQVYLDDTEIGQRRALVLTKHLYPEEADAGYMSDQSIPSIPDLAEYCPDADGRDLGPKGNSFKEDALDPDLKKERAAIRYAVGRTVDRYGGNKGVVERVADGLGISYALCCFVLKSSQYRDQADATERSTGVEGFGSYMELFCRTCFRFDCRIHNIQHCLSGSVAANEDEDFLAVSREAWTGNSKGCSHPGLDCNDPKSGCSCLQKEGDKEGKCTKFCCCFDLITYPIWNCRNKRTYCNCGKPEPACKNHKCACFAAGYFCDWDLCGCCFSERTEARLGQLPEKPRVWCARIWDERRAARSRTIVGKSRVHGWGLFAGQLIRSGDIVDEYLGEELDGEGIESQRREVWNRIVKRAYSFDKPDGDSGVVDGRFKGNRLRFINHLSAQDQKTYGLDSNCYPRCDLVDGEPRILVRTSRTIQPGEELFMDYGDGHTFVESATGGNAKAVRSEPDAGGPVTFPSRPWDVAPAEPAKAAVIDLT